MEQAILGKVDMNEIWIGFFLYYDTSYVRTECNMDYFTSNQNHKSGLETRSFVNGTL